LWCLRVGVVILKHHEYWISEFSHYEVGGDALLAELRDIHIGLDLCQERGYNNINCVIDCLETVELFVASRDHTSHTYAPNILHLRDVLHKNGNTTLVHVLREQNMCANFMAKQESYSRCYVHWDCPTRHGSSHPER